MRVVLDTNVLASAMLTGGGAPDEVVQSILRGDLHLLIDSRIMAEYDEVTSRLCFGLDAKERRMLLDVLDTIAEPVIARLHHLSLPDPDDIPFVEVAISGHADALVTGKSGIWVPCVRGVGADASAIMDYLRGLSTIIPSGAILPARTDAPPAQRSTGQGGCSRSVPRSAAPGSRAQAAWPRMRSRYPRRPSPGSA